MLDVVVCWKLDRFGRSLAHLINAIQTLTDAGVGFSPSVRASTPVAPLDGSCSASWAASRNSSANGFGNASTRDSRELAAKANDWDVVANESAPPAWSECRGYLCVKLPGCWECRPLAFIGRGPCFKNPPTERPNVGLIRRLQTPRHSVSESALFGQNERQVSIRSWSRCYHSVGGVWSWRAGCPGTSR